MKKILKITTIIGLMTLGMLLFTITDVFANNPCSTNADCTNECRPDPLNPAVQICAPRICAPPDGNSADTQWQCKSVQNPTTGGVDLKSVTDSSFRIPLVGNGGFAELLNLIVNRSIMFSFALLFVYIVWGSYRYLMSGGDPKAVQAAKAHLTWAIVGTIVIFLSYGLFRILSSLLGNVY